MKEKGFEETNKQLFFEMKIEINKRKGKGKE
jgi:hypothetical protein